MMVQVELSGKSTGVMHNNLIMQWEDKWKLQSTVLRNSLNLLGEEVRVARLIILLCIISLRPKRINYEKSELGSFHGEHPEWNPDGGWNP